MHIWNVRARSLTFQKLWTVLKFRTDWQNKIDIPPSIFYPLHQRRKTVPVRSEYIICIKSRTLFIYCFFIYLLSPDFGCHGNKHRSVNVFRFKQKWKMCRKIKSSTRQSHVNFPVFQPTFFFSLSLCLSFHSFINTTCSIFSTTPNTNVFLNIIL